MSFSSFGLSDHIVQGVRAAGYTVPTPIQQLAIEPALGGRDIIGCAQTGTGKTAAFVLPMLHRLAAGNGSSPHGRHPRALILTPTRELAHQVYDAVITYGKFLQLRAVTIYGGVNMENQIKLLRRGTDVVIATPGRLLDHVQRKSISLDGINILILDEADRMLDMGFINDVRKIIGKVPADRQTMLFSATLSDEINDLATRILRDPQLVQVGERRNPAETITQHFYSVQNGAKNDLLLHILEAENMESVLVFSRTKHGADKISRRLARHGISSMAIHSNRTQPQRQRALDGFKEGKYRVLVATDIAARGIDVDGISHVINFDIPHFAEDYIHRIGRTGRAGSSGDAITFLAGEDYKHLKSIQRFTGKRFVAQPYPGFTPPPREQAPQQAGEQQPRPHTHQRAARHPFQQPGTNPLRPRTATADRRRNDKQTRVHRKKRKPFEFARKKKSGVRKLDSFSSDMGGAGWSNY